MTPEQQRRARKRRAEKRLRSEENFNHRMDQIRDRVHEKLDHCLNLDNGVNAPKEGAPIEGSIGACATGRMEQMPTNNQSGDQSLFVSGVDYTPGPIYFPPPTPLEVRHTCECFSKNIEETPVMNPDEPLMPFNHYIECPKCGFQHYAGLKRRYTKGWEEKHEDRCEKMEEFLAVVCTFCNWVGKERPKDAG